MPHINLLPWRDKHREKQKQIYGGIVGLVALGVFGIVFGVSKFVDGLISVQKQRNEFMTVQVAVLDRQIEKIKELQQQRKELQQKIALIEQLQDSRNLTTQILNEIVNVVPPGIYIERLERKEGMLLLNGKSESNNRLSELMRNLEQSELFIQTELESIVAAERVANPISDFKMRITVKPIVSAEPENEQNKQVAS